MTSPGGLAPDGAWVVGGRYGQDITEASAKAAIRGQSVGGYEDAQATLKALSDDLDGNINGVRDGQLDLSDRIDLLEGVQGYCNLFLSKNWQISGNGTRITLPFDTQLGPNKGANPWNGQGIRLLTKGLWRADAHVSFMPPAPSWLTGVSSVTVQAWIKVVSTAGGANSGAFTEAEYDAAITSVSPETISFSHTFVVPSDDAYAVCVQVAQPQSGLIGLYGGTVRSALSVNKWDNGTSNAVVAPVVDNGGTL